MAGTFEGLTDLEWQLFADLFPPEPTKRGRGIPHTPFRKVVNTLLYVLLTGCRWCDLPRGPQWASKSAAQRWLQRWQADGTLAAMQGRLLGLAEARGMSQWPYGAVDGSCSPWHRRQSQIPLAQMWGGGEVASADGLRFVVPIRTINAGPNPKYFGVGRGVTSYNFTSDQFTGFHSIVIPGTLRDSLYILEGLLEQETHLQPLELMADTAGVSDLVFGLFWLLGYQFSPRLADVGEARFWRMDPQADYGALNALARQRINVPLIARNWDDMLRVAGSLLLGTVRASELLRSFLRSGRPSTLARALGELGRIPKTLYLLSYIDDETYRRRILLQLNRGEGRYRLARATFHGQRGELRQRYREGQEDQLSALGLVVNVIVLWNTLYMEAALNYVRAESLDIRPEDVARLSPLGYKHMNFLGQYSFDLAETMAQGALRPLRTSADLQEEFP